MSFYNFDFISVNAQAHGREFAYIDETRKVTFSELEIGTRKIAGYLKGIGVKQNDIVATILPSYLSWFFTFSLHRMGAAVLTKNTYSNFAPEVKPDFLISLKYHPTFPKEKTIVIDLNVMRKVEAALQDNNLDGYSDPHSPARFFSTSGTTGGTRYICYEAEKLEMLAQRQSPYDLVGLDHILTLYTFGAGQNYRLALKKLVAGQTYYCLDAGNTPSLKFIQENPIRTISASPVQISAFLDMKKQAEISLPNISTIILGGSRPSEKLIERIKSELDCRIFNSYGSTEAGLIGLSEITDGIEEFSGLNLVDESINLEIIDDEGNPLPANSIGHIRYQRSDMAMAYYKNPIATSEFFKNNFFYPGDLGFKDNQGRLHLEGRSTDVINLGGVKVNPERIEKIALAQLGVIDCAVYSQPVQSGIEELCLALVTDDDFEEEFFAKALASKISHPIRHIRSISAIPRNENGKIQRNLLREE